MKTKAARKRTRKPIKETRARARNLRTQRRRANPADESAAAAKLSEAFHGRAARTVREVEEEQLERTELADLGRLIELRVLLEGGRREAQLAFSGVRLAASADGGQLYLVGGDQELDLKALGLSKQLPKDHAIIGEVSKIAYHTRKGFHHFEPVDYTHEFGEERGGELPVLAYDTLNQKLYLTGGTYQVKPEGIVN